MNLEQIMAAIETLPSDEREQLKRQLNLQQQGVSQPKTVAEWIAEFADIARDFRGDSSEEEMREIVEAITAKSHSSDKRL